MEHSGDLGGGPVLLPDHSRRDFVGTDDARLMRLVGGSLEPLSGFDRVEGRDAWFAGTAVIDGKVVGPP